MARAPAARQTASVDPMDRRWWSVGLWSTAVVISAARQPGKADAGHRVQAPVGFGVVGLQPRAEVFGHRLIGCRLVDGQGPEVYAVVEAEETEYGPKLSG